LIPITNDIVKEFADMLATIATSSADSVITRDEAEIRARWEELEERDRGLRRGVRGREFRAAEDADAGRRNRPGPRWGVLRSGLGFGERPRR
jgi:hypothetical protein